MAVRTQSRVRYLGPGPVSVKCLELAEDRAWAWIHTHTHTHPGVRPFSDASSVDSLIAVQLGRNRKAGS